MIVSPQRTSVLWVGQKYDVVLEIRSTLGGPLEGAVATWLMDEDLGDPATDVFESLERNSAVSDGGGRVVLGAVPYPWAGRVLVTIE